MTIIYKLNLTAREAAVVYASLSKIQLLGVDAEAELSVRTMIEKIGVKKTGVSLHDLLVKTDAIADSEKPDIRTEKERKADLKMMERINVKKSLENFGVMP
jgi:hypothetical protein|tara:strand:+ start:1489 stop:1791 length:303 start_codon:yes stop_codon:yes gene_type:complete